MIGSSRRLLGFLSVASALIALALLAGPISAQAGVLSLRSCDDASLTQPFLPWADSSEYKLAPGGDFEGALSGWTLLGGATQTSGSESYGVTGSIGSSSLALPDGASATSPQTCVNAAYPSFRLFARSDTTGTTVTVSALYPTPQGMLTIPVGVITPGALWAPTLPMLTGSAVPGAVDGGTAQLSLAFSAHGGAAQIDDVYVDPHGRCC